MSKYVNNDVLLNGVISSKNISNKKYQQWLDNHGFELVKILNTTVPNSFRSDEYHIYRTYVRKNGFWSNNYSISQGLLHANSRKPSKRDIKHVLLYTIKNDHSLVNMVKDFNIKLSQVTREKVQKR